MLVLSHTSSSWRLVTGDRHSNLPGIAFSRGVTGWVHWEAGSEIDISVQEVVLLESILGEGKGREEKNRKVKNRIGWEEQEQEGKRKEQDWAKGEV